MKLNWKQYSGHGKPLLILHGLFGNHANWAWHARELAQDFQVYALDMRNHGASPWSDSHTYADMAEDLLDTLDALSLPSAAVLGHSMGGKAAMQLAFRAPQRVERLILVDIAPVEYPRERFAPLEGMLAIDTASIGSRAEADRVLAGYLEEKPVRDFLLTNLQREGTGYVWRCNLEVLARCYPAIKGRPEPMGCYGGAVLFIKGGESDYILREHEAEIRAAFPAAELKVVEGADHWVHSEKPQVMLKLARDFLME